jgi:hypothetical protein
VDFPAPPFSLPSTTTCAAAGRLLLACTSITLPQIVLVIRFKAAQ